MAFAFRFQGFVTTQAFHVERAIQKMKLGDVESITKRKGYWYVNVYSCSLAGEAFARELQHSPKKLIYGEWPNGSPKFWWIYKTTYRSRSEFMGISTQLPRCMREKETETDHENIDTHGMEYMDENGQRMTRQRISPGVCFLTRLKKSEHL